jgi:formate dehydrogenase iron-sulfur subunit
MAGKAILVDTTKCMACRACQVACKNWNRLPATPTTKVQLWNEAFGIWEKALEADFFEGPGYQNPGWNNFITYNLIRFLEASSPGEDVDGDGNWHFLRYACMHCIGPERYDFEPRCMKICRDKRGDKLAVYRDCDGFIQIDKTKCRPELCEYACVNWCAFKIPHVGRTRRKKSKRPPTWSKRWARKCTACIDRRTPKPWTKFPPVQPPLAPPPEGMPGCGPYAVPQYPATAAGNPNLDPIAGVSLLTDVLSGSVGGDLLPACVTSCPNGALKYGDRDDVVTVALARVADPEVTATWPNAMVYGDTGPFGGLRVVSVLSHHWSYYDLPNKDMEVT